MYQVISVSNLIIHPALRIIAPLKAIGSQSELTLTVVVLQITEDLFFAVVVFATGSESKCMQTWCRKCDSSVGIVEEDLQRLLEVRSITRVKRVSYNAASLMAE